MTFSRDIMVHAKISVGAIFALIMSLTILRYSEAPDQYTSMIGWVEKTDIGNFVMLRYSSSS